VSSQTKRRCWRPRSPAFCSRRTQLASQEGAKEGKAAYKAVNTTPTQSGDNENVNVWELLSLLRKDGKIKSGASRATGSTRGSSSRWSFQFCSHILCCSTFFDKHHASSPEGKTREGTQEITKQAPTGFFFFFAKHITWRKWNCQTVWRPFPASLQTPRFRQVSFAHINRLANHARSSFPFSFWETSESEPKSKGGGEKSVWRE